MGRWIAVVLACAVGCGEDERCAPEVYDEALRVESVEALDLLFVVDDSPSMAEERAAFAAELPALVETLTLSDASTTRFTSMHVGVATADMGTGPGGACTEWGDDGILQTAGDPSDAGCADSYPSWLTFAAGDDGAALGTSLRCVAGGAGDDGCLFRQPLEAMLKALTPSTSGLTFAGGTVGHGDGENAGFVRRDSLLAVVLLTNVDDCSAIDTGLFEPDNPRYDPNLPLRCFNHPESTQPLSRFIDGLIGLRSARPELLVVATIAGLPVDSVPSGEEPLLPSAMDILADDRMIERLDPEDSAALVAACESTDRGPAQPARRLLYFAAEVDDRGGTGVVRSICEPVADALAGVAAGIEAAAVPGCIPGELATPGGTTECSLFELLDPESGGTCEGPTRTAAGTDPDTERLRCRVQPADDGAGWSFDRADPDCTAIAFSAGAEPSDGSLLRLRCNDTALGGVICSP